MMTVFSLQRNLKLIVPGLAFNRATGGDTIRTREPGTRLVVKLVAPCCVSFVKDCVVYGTGNNTTVVVTQK